MQALYSPWIVTGFQNKFIFLVDLLNCWLDIFKIGIETENYICTPVYHTSVGMTLKKKKKVVFFLKVKGTKPTRLDNGVVFYIFPKNTSLTCTGESGLEV